MEDLLVWFQDEILSDTALIQTVFGFVKAFAVCMFALNVGVILTWAERRIRCMIQDGIGPNRAAIPLPGKVAAIGVAAGPAFTAAGVVLGLAILLDALSADQAWWGNLFLQGGLFVTWLLLAAISRAARRMGARNEIERIIVSLGPPRGVALVGISLQIVFLALGLYADTNPLYAGDFALFSFWGGSLLLASALVAGGAHVAAQYWKEKTVRLTLLGLLHPAADGLKTAFKADFIPPKGDKLLYNIAPWITLLPSLVILAVVPFGPNLCFGTYHDGVLNFNDFQGIESVGNACGEAYFSMQVADLNVGILYFFAVAGTGIVGAALAGWASDNKFSLLGGMRAASQMVSYEVTLGLTVVGALMVYGTVRIDEMVTWQAQNAWGIFVQPLAFFLFMTAAIAETKRVPFDIPEGESEIVAGYFTEYSGMKFAMFFFSEFIAVVSSSAIMAALFFGGWHMPFVTANGIEIAIGETLYYSDFIRPEVLAVMGVLSFIGKVLLLCVLQVVIRWTLPRFRYDQLMRLGWRKLLPASLFNVMVTAIVILAIQSSSAQVQAGIESLAQMTMLFIVALGAAAVIGLVVFLFAPSPKQRRIVNSAARYADLMGGTPEAKMEA